MKRNAILRAGAFPAVALLAAWAALPAAETPPAKAAPYYPTPEPIVTKMLEMAALRPGELLYDLGSGDGRIVIAAAEEFGARAVGFEIEPKLVEYSREQIHKRGLQDRARIENRDLFEADFSKPGVVTIYLMPNFVERLRPLLEEQLKPGARVVCHMVGVPCWVPDEVFTRTLDFAGERIEHKVFLYRR